MYAKEFGLNPRGSKKILRDFKYESNRIALLHQKEHLGYDSEEGMKDYRVGLLERSRWKKTEGMNLDTECRTGCKKYQGGNPDDGVDVWGKGQQRGKEV